MPIRHGGSASKKRDDVVSPQLPPHRHRTGSVDAMNLKDMLGDIQTDCCNLLHGRLSLM